MSANDIGNSQFVWAGGQVAPDPPSGSMAEVSALLRELIGVSRELLENSRHQLELSRRWEQRTVEQQNQQRGEFDRLLREYPHLKGRAKDVEEHVNAVVGKALGDLYDYVEEHGSDLSESDYIRSEMVDKYGGLLYHLYGIHGIVKRMSLFEQQQAAAAQQQKPPPSP